MEFTIHGVEKILVAKRQFDDFYILNLAVVTEGKVVEFILFVEDGKQLVDLERLEDGAMVVAEAQDWLNAKETEGLDVDQMVERLIEPIEVTKSW